MLKRRLLILAFAGLLSPAYGAGTIPFSFYPQVDLQGKVMPGCKFYTIQAGTVSTPQNAFQDSALTLPLPNPQTCDASGRLPQMFLADGQIKVRLTTSTGVSVLTADNVAVVGSSSGGGGGGSVDPTTVISTGDLKARYGVGVLSGFVRANGKTIGSASSGATERANADTQALFEYLWGTDANLVVSTGRGVSANADWVANKTIALPDWRGQAIGALADMGNSATSVLTSTYFSVDPTVLGAAGGSQSTQLSTAMLPFHSHSGTTAGIGPHRHLMFSPDNNGAGSTTGIAAGNFAQYTTNFGNDTTYEIRGSIIGNDAALGLTSAAGADGGRSFVTNGGDGVANTPFSNITPMKLATIYIKL